jgi:hypothetical protein
MKTSYLTRTREREVDKPEREREREGGGGEERTREGGGETPHNNYCKQAIKTYTHTGTLPPEKHSNLCPTCVGSPHTVYTHIQYPLSTGVNTNYNM